VTRARAFGDSLWIPLVLTGALAVLVYGAPALTSSLEPTAVDMMVNLAVVVGLFVFVGNSGVISFGQIAFMAIGAYTAALLTIPPQTKGLFLHLPGFLAHAQFSTVPAIVLAGAVAGVFALLSGSALMRLSGIAAGIATFSLLVIVNTVGDNWTNLTGGENPLVGIPPSTTRIVALITCAVLMLGASWYTGSGAGLRVRATREDAVAAASVGIHVWRERLIAFTLSGICVGVGGALYSGYIGSFNGDSFYIDLTILTLAMLVVGGVGSLTGAFVGTVVISVIEEFFRRLSEGMNFGPLYLKSPNGSEQVVLALCLLVILVLRPSGLTHGKDVPSPSRLRAWLHRQRRPAVATAAAEPAPDVASPELVADTSKPVPASVDPVSKGRGQS
jgi:branched-chain amino acid transport system permease protein